MNFEEIINSESYWNSINIDKILIEKGDIEKSKESIQVNIIGEDLYDIMFDYYLENEKIIEEAIKIHIGKRYNRKYINARKNLIKDKRNVIREAWAKGKSEMYRQDLVEKNVVSMDNEVNVHYVQKEKTTIVIPKFVNIKFYSKFNGYDFKDHIKGKFIVTEKEDRFILETIPFEDRFAWEPKKIIMKDNIFDIFMKDRKDLAFDKIIQRGFDYTWASYYLSGNTFFYGKPYKNGFIGNINIDKFNHDYNGWITAKAMKIKKTKQSLDILEKEGFNEWFENERRDAFHMNYFDWEDFEEENDCFYPSGIEGYVRPFLGMDKFYYDDNGGFDLLEKYEEDQYSCEDPDYYKDSYMYDDFWE